MPVISVRLAKGRSIDSKRAAAKAITDAAVETLGVRREWVTVLFEEFDRENWSSGGELHSDRFGPGHGRAGETTDG